MIDYRHEEFVEKLKQLVSDGIDVAFDGLGWQSFKRSLKTIKPGGMLVAYGFSNAVGKRQSVCYMGFHSLQAHEFTPRIKKKDLLLDYRIEKAVSRLVL